MFPCAALRLRSGEKAKVDAARKEASVRRAEEEARRKMPAKYRRQDCLEAERRREARLATAAEVVEVQRGLHEKASAASKEAADAARMEMETARTEMETAVMASRVPSIDEDAVMDMEARFNVMKQASSAATTTTTAAAVPTPRWAQPPSVAILKLLKPSLPKWKLAYAGNGGKIPRAMRLFCQQHEVSKVHALDLLGAPETPGGRRQKQLRRANTANDATATGGGGGGSGGGTSKLNEDLADSRYDLSAAAVLEMDTNIQDWRRQYVSRNNKIPRAMRNFCMAHAVNKSTALRMLAEPGGRNGKTAALAAEHEGGGTHQGKKESSDLRASPASFGNAMRVNSAPATRAGKGGGASWPARGSEWAAQETKRGGSKRRETGQGAQSILKRYPSTNGGGASVRQVSFGGVPARKRNTESPKEVTRKRFQIET